MEKKRRPKGRINGRNYCYFSGLRRLRLDGCPFGGCKQYGIKIGGPQWPELNVCSNFNPKIFSVKWKVGPLQMFWIQFGKRKRLNPGRNTKRKHPQITNRITLIENRCFGVIRFSSHITGNFWAWWLEFEALIISIWPKASSKKMINIRPRLPE